MADAKTEKAQLEQIKRALAADLIKGITEALGTGTDARFATVEYDCRDDFLCGEYQCSGVVGCSGKFHCAGKFTG